MSKNEPPVGMSMEDWIRQLILTGELWRFYKSREWLELRGQVLRESRGKCVRCLAKSPSVVRSATTVHHDQWVKLRPELALCKTYIRDGQVKQNLFALCDDCHNEVHERFGHTPAQGVKAPLTPERW